MSGYVCWITLSLLNVILSHGKCPCDVQPFGQCVDDESAVLSHFHFIRYAQSS